MSFVVLRWGGELRARLWSAPMALLAFAAGLGASPAETEACRIRGNAMLSARVEAVRFRETASVSLRVIEGRLLDTGLRIPKGIGVRARLPNEAAPPVGSTVTMKAKLLPSISLRNRSPHPSPPPSWQQSCRARSMTLEMLSTPIGARPLASLRGQVRADLDRTLPGETAGVARALVLGDGGALPYRRRQTIAAVGLAHLFAVSGLHIALVSGLLVRVLHWLLRGWLRALDPMRIAAALGIPLTLAHAAFAGGSPSAWRAATTAAITWAFVAANRRPSATAVTATAALTLSTLDPATALRPAFLLSIVATAAILSAPLERRSGPWRRLRTASTISARTLVGTAPMVWWWFGGVPVIGWLTNIVVLPLGSLVLIPLAHLYAATLWLPPATTLLRPLLEVTAELLLWICEVLSPLAFARKLPPLTPAQGWTVLVTCLGLMASKRWKLRLAWLICGSLAWGVLEHRVRVTERPIEALRVSFLDVGQGDAALIDLPDGRLVLVDTGQGGWHPAAETVASILRARRRTKIDLVVITHGHPDHAGGLAHLLNEVRIEEIWLNGQRLAEERNGTAKALVALARKRGTRVQLPEAFCGSPIEARGATLEAIWPCPRYDPGFDWNDNSIVLRLRFGQHAFLLAGDLEAEAEHALLRAGIDIEADVLKVGHHGSRTSTTQGFVAAVRPTWAVISAGRANPYGHPHASVLERLRDAGVRVLRTGARGGVTITSKGNQLRVETWRDKRIFP